MTFKILHITTEEAGGLPQDDIFLQEMACQGYDFAVEEVVISPQALETIPLIQLGDEKGVMEKPPFSKIKENIRDESQLIIILELFLEPKKEGVCDGKWDPTTEDFDLLFGSNKDTAMKSRRFLFWFSAWHFRKTLVRSGGVLLGPDASYVVSAAFQEGYISMVYDRVYDRDCLPLRKDMVDLVTS